MTAAAAASKLSVGLSVWALAAVLVRARDIAHQPERGPKTRLICYCAIFKLTELVVVAVVVVVHICGKPNQAIKK